MYPVSYLSLLMTSLSGLLVFDSRSLRGELFTNSTFKGGPSENMIGNFRHNLHIISIKTDMAITLVFDSPFFRFREVPPVAMH